MPKAIKAGITKQPSRHNPYDLPNTLRKPQDPEAAETSLYLEEDSGYFSINGDSNQGSEIAPALTHPRCYDNDHVEKLATFAHDLDQALKKSFPLNEEPNPYTAVHVLLLRWLDDDLQVQIEISEQNSVFAEQFSFQVEQWQIPSVSPTRALQTKLYDFQDARQSEKELLIVYYGGHSEADTRRGRSIWRANGQPNSPRLNWSSLQPLLETAVPHVLIILDCCFAANAARDTTEGTTKEILAACGRENPTPAVCNRSFTSALVEEMQSFGDTPFTVAMLHARLITMRWRLRFTPVHALLAEHGGNSITLSRLQETGNLFVRQTDRPAASTTEFDGTAPAVPDGSSSKGEQLPPLQVPPLQTADSRVLLSVSVTQGAELELAEWTRWLTSAVPWDVMKVDVQIHGIFRSHSSLVLVSMPINAWNLLSDRPAYRFIGFIRSDNLLKKAGSTEATGVVTRSRSRWPEFVCAKRENTTDFNKMTLRGQVPGQASFTAIKAIMGPPSSRHFSPLWQPPQALSSGHWNLGDDEALIQARAMGLNWQPIANQYFPGKTPNACRKRHERLMEKRNEEEQKRWDNANYESLAKAYTDVREQMWKILADRLGEEWQTVERRSMWKGLAALQLLGRTEPRHARAASDDHGFKGGEANPFPFAIGHQMSPRDCNDDFMNGNKIDIEGVNHQHLQQQQSVPASSSGRCLPDVSDSWRDLESRSSSILTH